MATPETPAETRAYPPLSPHLEKSLRSEPGFTALYLRPELWVRRPLYWGVGIFYPWQKNWFVHPVGDAKQHCHGIMAHCDNEFCRKIIDAEPKVVRPPTVPDPEMARLMREERDRRRKAREPLALSGWSPSLPNVPFGGGSFFPRAEALQMEGLPSSPPIGAAAPRAESLKMEGLPSLPPIGAAAPPAESLEMEGLPSLPPIGTAAPRAESLEMVGLPSLSLDFHEDASTDASSSPSKRMRSLPPE